MRAADWKKLANHSLYFESMNIATPSSPPCIYLASLEADAGTNKPKHSRSPGRQARASPWHARRGRTRSQQARSLMLYCERSRFIAWRVEPYECSHAAVVNDTVPPFAAMGTLLKHERQASQDERERMRGEKRRVSTTSLFVAMLGVYSFVFFLQSSRHIVSVSSNKERNGRASASVDKLHLTKKKSSLKTVSKPQRPITKPVKLPNHAITLIAENVKIPVVVWPNVEYGAETAASMHLEENGIAESLILELSTKMWDFSPNVVWVADVAGYDSEEEFCSNFLEKVEEAIDKRAQLGLPSQWPVFIVDWTDYGMDLQCESIETILGLDYIKYTQRATVYGRKWNNRKGWVNVGWLNKDNGIYFRQAPLPVRTDTVEALARVLLVKFNTTLASPIEKFERGIDVAHFWPIDLVGVRNTGDARLRLKVSQIVADVGNSTDLNAFVGLAGNASSTGRRQAQSSYIETMLDSKIVVVSQRDNWEDHYRLFEALVSGAMVMTDRMLSLPEGLENGTSIVEFGSADDLRFKLLYYTQHSKERLKIASRGREVSMKRHRSWHRMEEIIFGRVVSDCSRAQVGSHCPWIVHAIELNV